MVGTWVEITDATFSRLSELAGRPLRCAIPPSTDYRDVVMVTNSMKAGIEYWRIEFADGDIATGVDSDPINLMLLRD